MKMQRERRDEEDTDSGKDSNECERGTNEVKSIYGKMHETDERNN